MRFLQPSVFPCYIPCSGLSFSFLLLLGMVIQRTHFGWKEFLATRKWLDFTWPQHWQSSSGKDTGILCHMAPFDLYSIKHSCGPYPETCLDFDFKQIPGQFSERFPIQITSHNLQERAEVCQPRSPLKELRDKCMNHIQVVIADVSDALRRPLLDEFKGKVLIKRFLLWMRVFLT